MTDSIALTDSASAAVAATEDTVVHDTSYVLVADPPARPPSAARPEQPDDDISWVVGGLLLLFVIVAIRFRNNSKFLGTLLKGAFENRERGNVFDDTVRETSFMIVLNLLWCLCAGVFLYVLSGGRPDLPGAPYGMAIGVLLAAAYEIFMLSAYWIVANIFSDSLHARMWIRGFLSATGLTVLILFPAALVLLCYPGAGHVTLLIGLITFFLGKIVFICKGFRIFFSQIGAWVLFLYYLCSLEIVPLVLLYIAASAFCI